MRIVLITGESLGHRYVANKLAAEFKLAGIVVDHGTTGGRWRRLWKRYTIGQLISRAGLKLLAWARHDGVRQRERLAYRDFAVLSRCRLRLLACIQ